MSSWESLKRIWNRSSCLIPTSDESYKTPAWQYLHFSIEMSNSSTMNYPGLQESPLCLTKVDSFASGQECEFCLAGTNQHYWETSRQWMRSFPAYHRLWKYLSTVRPPILGAVPSPQQRLAPTSTQPHDDTLGSIYLQTSISAPPPNLSPSATG